jgi:hypothetical protein
VEAVTVVVAANEKAVMDINIVENRTIFFMPNSRDLNNLRNINSTLPLKHQASKKSMYRNHVLIFCRWVQTKIF